MADPLPATPTFGQRLLGRHAVRVALWLLLGLAGSAIFAPLIASDRPYLLEAVDYGAHARARRTLRPAAESLARLTREGAAAYAREREAGEGPTWNEAVRAEVGAVRRAAARMAAQIGEKDREPLDRLAATVDGVILALETGDRAAAAGVAERAAARAAALHDSHVARRPGETAGIELLPRRSWPLLSTLRGLDVALMALWSCAALALALGPRVRPGLGSRLGLGSLAVAVLLGALWPLVRPQGLPGAPPEKAGLSTGDIVATRAIFPPVAAGFAETNLTEVFRPPTWSRSSRLEERERDSTAPSGDDFAIGEFVPPDVPVAVRYAEPPLDSPWRHPLGTDGSGRDLLARALWGGRVSLTVGVASTAILVLLGTLIGSVAGWFGGWLDALVLRCVEVLMSIPAFFLIVAASAFVDPDTISPMLAIVCIIAVVRWTGVARLTRAELLRAREAEYVLAARALGLSSARTILRHVLPNAAGPILVAAAFAVAAGILTESAVSFLGFGIEHPMPSWGALIHESTSAEHWWVQAFPGLLICLTVTCANLVGEGIRDALDPTSRS